YRLVPRKNIAASCEIQWASEEYAIERVLFVCSHQNSCCHRDLQFNTSWQYNKATEVFSHRPFVRLLLPTVDNLRNLFLNSTTEMFRFLATGSVLICEMGD